MAEMQTERSALFKISAGLEFLCSPRTMFIFTVLNENVFKTFLRPHAKDFL